jgi:hypothetical protein
MKDSLRLALSRSALLPLVLLALSCGGGGGNKPPVKDPPQAVLSVPKPNVAGPKLTVSISATGCDQIQSLSIYDGEDFLKSVPYSGPGSVSVDLLANEVKYTRGIAVQMSLKARVVCTDGRQNDSQPQPATFFPAAEVIEPRSGGQVVTDNFVVEGSLPLPYFIGCGNDASQGGKPYLYKVDKNGNVVNQTAMPFLCTTNTVITPKNASSGKRWVWTPDAGAIAVDSSLTITGRVTLPLDLLEVGPDGDAIIYDAGAGGSAKQVYRARHDTGANRWPRVYNPIGLLINSPVARGSDIVFASVTSDGASAGRANIVVARVDYGLQDVNTGGIELGNTIMTEIASDTPLATEAPPSIFSPDGNVLYMAFGGLGGVTEVRACVTSASGCQGTAQRWANPPILTGAVVALVPYAAGTRVAAIAPQKVWFLDASNGNVTNKGGIGSPMISSGALVVLQVQSGAAGNPLAFYLLNGPAPQTNLPPPQPLEIVATDDPAKGELYRYSIGSGSMAVAIDDAGTLWMRAGPNLVRPLTLAEYRQVRPVSP